MDRKRFPQIERSVFSELFPELDKPRAQNRAILILEGAIRTYATVGAENATYEAIASACGIDRRLLAYYFKDRDEIFSRAIKYIRVCFQNLAIRRIKEQTAADRMLAAYVDSTFEWVEELPDHGRVWMFYFYQCTRDRKLRDLNTAFVKAGHQRIAALLRLGGAQGCLSASHPLTTAKLIQALISGAMVSVICEKLTTDYSSFRRQVIETSLALAGAVKTPR